MATKFEALRDGRELDCPLSPPGASPGNFVQFDSEEAPVRDARSFFVGQNLDGPMFNGDEPRSHRDYFEHPLYARYMRLPKGLLPPADANVLQDIHEGLAAERASRFLFASGWAAAEAAIVMRGVRNNERVRERLVEGAANAWLGARDRAIEIAKGGGETGDHYALKERTELALASVPLLEDIVAGNVKVETLGCVADGYIQVGVENTAFGKEKRETGDTKRAVFHEGLSYEILALLGLGEDLTPRRFAMPATARNDSGYYFPKLTHDLMIFKQRGGQLKSMLPAEIKSKMSRYDRRRYKALVIDGPFMDVLQAGEPGPMIDLVARVHHGDGTEADRAAVTTMTRNLWAMVAQYSSGDTIRTGGSHSFIQFHDTSKVRLGGYAASAALAAV